MTKALAHRLGIVAVVLSLIGAVATFVWVSAYRQALNNLAERSAADLTLASDRVSTQLQIYRELAVLTVDHPILRTLRNAAGRAAASDLMRSYADKTGALDVFYADASGQVLAAAEGVARGNIKEAQYFQRAIQGGLGNEPSVLSDGRRVYFFAAPDFGQRGQVQGVLVVVAEVQYLEQTWPGSLPAVYFTTQRGEVFISNRYELLFWRRLSDGLGLAPVQGPALPPKVDIQGGHEIWQLGWSPYLPERALHLAVDLPTIGMMGEILVDVAPARRLALLQALAIAAVCLASAAMVFLASERRRALAEANQKLEARVDKRTRDLSLANQQLKREIHEREEAEAALRQAQADLVRADKLSALGRMSAGISHELNQPLMAIQQFATNGSAFLNKGRPDRAGENLGRITDMATRMGRIIKNMRAFARNESEPMGKVDLIKVVEDAIELTQARLHDCHVRLEWSPQPRGTLWVRGGEVRLTQVFVNLLNNAVDAMLDQDDRLIRVVVNDGKKLAVTIRDIGPGLKEPEKVFDPFYSTKTVGASDDGMGLGLSISYGLVQSFGGNISGTNAPKGAMFTVELEYWKEEVTA